MERTTQGTSQNNGLHSSAGRPAGFQAVFFGERQYPQWIVVSLSILFILILGYIDYRSGYEFSFSIFYFFPVMIATWYGRRHIGVIISVLSAVSWYMCDIYSGHVYSNAIIPYWNSFMRFSIFIIVTYLLSAIKSYMERERELIRTDPLTGIGNSKAFYETAGAELERLRRYGNIFSLVYIDLDNFKAVNDTLGHNTGDKLLRITAGIIKENVRAIDTVARLGGDEFAILFPETDLSSAISVCKRIQAEMLDIMKKNNWPVTCSIGIAAFRTPLESVDDLVSKADSLMYEVKSSGKNNILAKEY